MSKVGSSDSSIIVEKIKKEINSYESSRAKGKKLIFEKSTPELLNSLEQFLNDFFDKYSKTEEVEEISEFVEHLYSTLGWKKNDY